MRRHLQPRSALKASRSSRTRLKQQRSMLIVPKLLRQGHQLTEGLRFIRDQMQLEADAREALPYVRTPLPIDHISLALG